MSYTLFSEDARIAKKAHRCIWCGQRINLGARYIDERSIYDGNIQRHRWHPECHEDARREGEEELTPYDNERPAIEARSSELIAGIEGRENSNAKN